MRSELKTNCILCGGTIFQQRFTLKSDSAGRNTGAVLDPYLNYGEDYRVISCKSCGLTFRQDFSSDSKTPLPYPHFPPGGPEEDTTVQSIRSRPDSDSTPFLGFEELNDVSDFLTPPGSLLNIGDDGTDILETARLQGWDSSVMSHLEPELIAQPEAAIGEDLLQQQYDVIRLENSLERTADPFALIEKVSGMLQKDGLLVITTPDISDWDFQIYGEGPSLWPIDLPRWFFTPDVLERLLAISSYKVLKVSRFSMTVRLPEEVHLGGPTLELSPISVTTPELSELAVQDIPFFRILARRNEKGDSYPLNRTEREAVPAEIEGLSEFLSPALIE
ncbi:hypothetical protein CEE37_01135 [candidate division LCP-89 bacterium B3_LCP]|uniref:Methyltransferase putative zinc binding domain-containing protein n=1 Tax=candidate division LCP-89 bacterium B3_LCP TaxID=2012998 RepID=A0A532V532_UNCL8|nr:MAG: hypothetical protein CEE37_01135 [candidate division LCP-89 bacterium B3_LCP]